jgi:hypothetical protein
VLVLAGEANLTTHATGTVSPIVGSDAVTRNTDFVYRTKSLLSKKRR